jgi:UDP-N-acetylmuramate dehydrogenase
MSSQGEDKLAAIVTAITPFCAEQEITLRARQRLANHTALGVGGEIAAIAYPETREAAAALVTQLSRMKIDWFALGGGSRLWALDAPVAKVAISLKLLEELLTFREQRLYIPGGYRLSRIREALQARGFSTKWLNGAWGSTLGGAIQAVRQPRRSRLFAALESLSIVRENTITNLTRETISNYQGELVLGAVAMLSPISQLDSQPSAGRFSSKQKPNTTIFSTGPVFETASRRSVAKLLTSTHLAQVSCGPARLAPHHPNFIVHDGTATAADIQGLLNLLINQLRARTGEQLASRLVLLADNLTEGVTKD